MYGSSGKLGGRGRGSGGGGSGGRGGGKRNRSPFPPPPSNRPIVPISTTTSNRLSTGGGASSSVRNRHESAKVPSSPDESYSLVSDDPLSYAMIIRLAPDLVEGIRRVEAQGETARIKFDSNANNSFGNVIDVGGKDFRFTWSQEVGDLCDIYEERRSSDDGKGLLIESGCPWRKLSVQRILDESTKNHVKMRSEEAEQRSKSRKAIVLDHGNPSMKNQLKSIAAAAVDSNPRKMGVKSKKEPAPKKRKVEPLSQGPPKSVFKAGLSSSATPPKGRLPFPSPEQPVASTSPFGGGSLSKASAAIEVPCASSKENAVTEKVTPSRTVHAVGREASRIKKGLEATPKDLQSMLIKILLENPKGMTIKGLEKELGDSVPNCWKKLEPILKKIAIYEAPRYLLKTGVDLDVESFKKLSSGSGSSAEIAHDQTHRQGAVEKATPKASEHQKQLESEVEESNIAENVAIQQNSPKTFGDKKTSDHSDGHASSSESDSDSDSDSDSSDSGSSGSQSKSRSKSRSPAGSGSSSDSESDGSSSSKEGSDVDVDIMTGDDDREEPGSNLPAHITTAPMPWRTPDDGLVRNGISKDKQDARMSDIVDIVGGLPNDDIEIDILGDDDTVPLETNTRSLEENVMPGLSQPGDGRQRSFVRNGGNENQNMTSYFDLDSSNRNAKAKSRKGSEPNYSCEKSESAKRMKPGGLNPPQTSGRSKDSFASEDPQHISLNRPDHDSYNVHLSNKVGRDGISDTSSRKGYNLSMAGISVSDAQRLGQRSGDLNARGKALDMANRYTDNLARGVESERSPSLPHDKFSMSRDKHSEDAYGNEKSVGNNVRECDVGDSYMGSLPKDITKTDPEKSPIANRKGKVLRREVSELELGELPAEETQGVKKQFGRNNSFRNSKNKSVVPDNLDLNGRTSAKTIQESRKLSPPNSRVGIGGTQESSFRKRTPEDENEDSWMRQQQRVGQYQAPQMPRTDLTDSEAGSQLNKLSDMGGKSRKNGYLGTNKKGLVSLPQQPETKSSGQVAVPNNVKESKLSKSSTMPEPNERRDSFVMGSHNSSRKRRESSSDEVNCPYSKYEKDEPELRGPIKDISQYKDYVQEYCEKYESYCTLNENLETYRNDFDKLGQDLALAKVKDRKRYYDILEQLKESYRQCGTRHKRLKKIFILLHEELKHLKQRINDFALPYTRD
ncbi:dentin sialophosphoprotein-like isoform X1 [Papaver somniferum]|uniref:dentin sialophosphoprotein-like isoform X1 n=2 Tax=Papaver somniferum TaxID=3469 RepID=UPI000E7039B3|nr:dentin sialophosphoprotein-like isoform X1 [Papaver somniferum]